MDEEKGPVEGGAYLVWEDLKVVLPIYYSGERKKPLLQGLTGYAAPGRVMAIMGPSGSGKTTLLNSLAGRLQSNVVVSGSIRLNGDNKRLLQYGAVAYVTQETTFLTTLTVRETMTYSAYLRLPSRTRDDEVKQMVEGMIEQMGLWNCINQIVGGISTGEKRRLSVALELLTEPPLLFVDEPTTGLDSAAALLVMVALKRMAGDGKTIVTSVHQPNGDVFSLFDDLCLLSEGEMVYFGDAKEATEFFRQAGFPCPSRQNPSDHFLRCINTDFEKVMDQLGRSQRFIKYTKSSYSSVKNTDEHVHQFDHTSDKDSSLSSHVLLNMEATTSKMRSRLIDHYNKSIYPTSVRKIIKEISNMESCCNLTEDTVYAHGSQASIWKQFVTLTKRSMLKARRDSGYYWLRIIIFILTSICIGTIFFDVGTRYESIQSRSSVEGFVFSFMTIMSIGWFSYFVEEMKVFSRERLNGHYGAFVFVTSSLVTSLPLLFVLSLCSSSVLYYMVKLHPGFSHFWFFAVNLFACLAVVESIMMIIASLVPNFLMGIVAGAGFLVILMLAAGYGRRLNDIPKPIWRIPLSYLSYASWALQGQYKNDLLGLQFESLAPASSKLTGEFILENMFELNLEQSKWLDFIAILVLLVSYRLIFLLIVKLKENVSTLSRVFHAKVANSV